MATPTLDGNELDNVEMISYTKDANIVPLPFPGADSSSTETWDLLGVTKNITIVGTYTGAVATVNGAVSDSATITVDGVSGTIATGQVVTVQDTSSLDISDNGGDTGISTDNSLTITAVASQTSFTVSENITVGNNKVLLLMADGGEDMLTESLEMKFEGVDNATDITGLTRTGGDSEVVMLLEDASNDTGRDTIVLNGTDGSSTNANDNILVEDKTSDIAMYSQVGSSTGTANILAGVTTT